MIGNEEEIIDNVGAAIFARIKAAMALSICRGWINSCGGVLPGAKSFKIGKLGEALVDTMEGQGWVEMSCAGGYGISHDELLQAMSSIKVSLFVDSRVSAGASDNTDLGLVNGDVMASERFRADLFRSRMGRASLGLSQDGAAERICRVWLMGEVPGIAERAFIGQRSIEDIASMSSREACCKMLASDEVPDELLGDYMLTAEHIIDAMNRVFGGAS